LKPISDLMNLATNESPYLSRSC